MGINHFSNVNNCNFNTQQLNKIVCNGKCYKHQEPRPWNSTIANNYLFHCQNIDIHDVTINNIYFHLHRKSKSSVALDPVKLSFLENSCKCFSYPSVLTSVMGSQTSRCIEAVLLNVSSHV